MFDSRILAFRVFTNKHGVDIIIRCLEAFDGSARADVGKQVERPAEGKVQGNVTLSD